MRVIGVARCVLVLWLVGCGSASTETPGTGPGLASGGAGSGGSAKGSLGGSGGAGSIGSNAGGAFAAGGASSASGGASNVGASGSSNSNAGASGGGSPSAGAPSGSAGTSAIVTPPGYTLVWHDEFDVDGAPNAASWKFEQGFVRNEEDQWYQRNNATVQGGMLLIEARQETVVNPNYTGTGDWRTTRKTAAYTSASINTSGAQSFQYGRFEMRARIPTSAGMWPAWWTLGVSGEWPSNGEIDIMEYYRNNVLANVACGTATRFQAKWDSTTKALASLGADWSSQFHIWTMDWDAQSIVLSLDGQTLNSSALSSMLNADGTSPFKQKAYMLLNLALGGQNGGDPSASTFPQRYEIDYVRVFQKQ